MIRHGAVANKTQPPSLRTAAEMLWFCEQQSRLASEGRAFACENRRSPDKFVEQIVKTDDANDAVRARSLT
jgi:hypothetical protein